VTGTKIVGLGGSLREPSRSRAALEVALDGAASAGATVELLDLHVLQLPMYSPELETDAPAVVHRLIETCYEADGMLWSSPMYNGSVSGSKPLLMLRAPLITTFTRALAKTRDNRAGGDFRLNDVARRRRRRCDREVAVCVRQEEELPLAAIGRRCRVERRVDRSDRHRRVENRDIRAERIRRDARDGRRRRGTWVRRRGGRRNAAREHDRHHAPYEPSSAARTNREPNALRTRLRAEPMDMRCCSSRR
jgi:NADPH-dependent FMN reductase